MGLRSEFLVEVPGRRDPVEKSLGFCMEVANMLSSLTLEATDANIILSGRLSPSKEDNEEIGQSLDETATDGTLSGEVGPDTGVTTESRELSRPEYKSDDFRMFRLKIEPCSNPNPHCYTDCPFSHPNEKAKRRDPTKIQYDATACPHFRKGQCQFGNACPCAHGVFELWLHPSKYKTELCTRPREVGKECEHPTCFFAHHESELRLASSVSPTGPPLMSPSGSIQSSPSERDDILNNEAMAAALHQAASLVQQQRSGSISASPFADPTRLGSLPFDDFNARSFIAGGPLLTQRSPSMDAAPMHRRPMQFSSGYNAPRHFTDAVAMSRAPSAPVIPRHLLSQQLGGSLPPLDLQHGRSLEPSIKRALLQNPHAAYGHPPLPTHMAAGMPGQGTGPSWMSPSGGASLPHNMDLARLLGHMTMSNAMQKGLNGHLDPSMVTSYSLGAPTTPNGLHGLATSDLPGLHTSGLPPLDRIVTSSFLSDTLEPTLHLNAGPQAYYLNHG